MEWVAYILTLLLLFAAPRKDIEETETMSSMPYAMQYAKVEKKRRQQERQQSSQQTAQEACGGYNTGQSLLFILT